MVSCGRLDYPADRDQNMSSHYDIRMRERESLWERRGRANGSHEICTLEDVHCCLHALPRI
jgi:hypothetical protein